MVNMRPIGAVECESAMGATRLLKEEKVACVPGSAFGACGEGFIRCCFATSLEQIQVATERMAKFVAGLKKG